MLADEITTDLRAISANVVTQAQNSNQNVSRQLVSKGIRYGSITARPNGTLDTSQITGVDADLRVKPFFHHGNTTSIHEFIVGAFNDEMGMQAVDADLMAAHNGGRFVTVGGMVLDGSKDLVKAPPTDNPAVDVDNDGITNEIPASVVDHLEFYLLNYFKPANYEKTEDTERGREIFQQVGCASCHVRPDATAASPMSKRFTTKSAANLILCLLRQARCSMSSPTRADFPRRRNRIYSRSMLKTSSPISNDTIWERIFTSEIMTERCEHSL